MVNLADGHLPLTSLKLLCAYWEEIAGGFQITGFLAPELRNFHLEKTCLLVEHRGENISFRSLSPWLEIRPYWEYFIIIASFCPMVLGD